MFTLRDLITAPQKRGHWIPALKIMPMSSAGQSVQHQFDCFFWLFTRGYMRDMVDHQVDHQSWDRSIRTPP